MKVAPPLSAKEDLARLHAKYPEGLLCTSPLPCDHRVIATTRAGYATSSITEEQRRAYVCAECRQADAERARVASMKVEKARAAGEAARAARRLQKPSEQAIRPGTRTPRIGRLDVPGIMGVPEGSFDLHQPSERSRGGRPRKHDNDKARRTSAQAAYRARKKLQTVGA